MSISTLQLTNAIRKAQASRLWKPGSANRHLQKRKSRHHLPAEAALADYEQIIAEVVHERSAQVYIYQESDDPYIAIAATWRTQLWLVIFNLDGILDTAFVVKNPQNYLNKPEFTFVDQLGDLL